MRSCIANCRKAQGHNGIKAGRGEWEKGRMGEKAKVEVKVMVERLQDRMTIKTDNWIKKLRYFNRLMSWQRSLPQSWQI